MSRSRLLIVVIGLFGLWLQLMAPALAVGMRRPAFDPQSAICHGAGGGGTQPPIHPHGPTCDHCPLCQAFAGGPPPEGQTFSIAFVRPSASLARARGHDTPAPAPRICRDSAPRGPPILV